MLFGLHIVEKFCSPPYRLPYLYHLLFASVSFMVNLAALVLLNGILIEDSWKKLKSYSAKQN